MNGIDTTVLHAAIVVSDLETAIEGWTALAGKGPTGVMITGTLEEAGTRYRGNPTVARCKQAFFDLSGFPIELIEPVDGPSVWADQLETRGEGLHHLAFRVRGMDDGIAACDALGMSLVQRGEFDKGRYAYLEPARVGMMVELLEFDPGHSDYRDDAAE